jgi:hypothetical protein
MVGSDIFHVTIGSAQPATLIHNHQGDPQAARLVATDDGVIVAHGWDASVKHVARDGSKVEEITKVQSASGVRCSVPHRSGNLFVCTVTANSADGSSVYRGSTVHVSRGRR